MPDAYATRMHNVDAEEKRTEQMKSTNGESFVTFKIYLALGNAHGLSAHA
jgi:hypothetical protein